MRKRFRWIGVLLVLSMGAMLTGCGGEKTVGAQQVALATNLIDKANNAVDNANQQNPDGMLDNLPKED